MKTKLNYQTAKNLIETYCIDEPLEDSIDYLQETGIELIEEESAHSIEILPNWYATQRELDNALYNR